MITPDLIEVSISFGIFLLASALSGASYVAWRRERDKRMATVTLGYVMFGVYGLVVVLEHFLVPYIAYGTLEYIEYGAAVLILTGLLTFFIAITQE